jgi:hypothetical protein
VQYKDNDDSKISTQDFFEIDIVDSCDEPQSISASTLVDQEYTVTGALKPYKFDAFTVDPAWCAITYTYTVEELTGSGGASNIDQLVSFDSDMSARRFSFSYSADLSPSGSTYKDYLITVNAVSGNDV